LSFSKKERIAVLVLLFLIVFIFLLPNFFPASKSASNQQAFEQFKNELARLNTAPRDSFNMAVVYHKKDNLYAARTDQKTRSFVSAAVLETFYFDPNTLSADQWKRLGLGERTVQTIQKYIARGGRFRSAADLQKIYGLHAQDYNRLQSFVRIAVAATAGVDKRTAFLPGSRRPAYKTVDAPVDINTADTTELVALPGIGERLAGRIVAFRQKLGGFYRVDQVAEVYALPDSTFLKIRPFLKIADSSVALIDVNTAVADSLKQHPYIRWGLANAIVQYRKQHGPFKSVDDLQSIAQVTPEVFRKIVHYLRVGPG